MFTYLHLGELAFLKNMGKVVQQYVYNTIYDSNGLEVTYACMVGMVQ